MTTDPWHLEPLAHHTHDQTRQLILDGLEEHWGELDPTLKRPLQIFEQPQRVVDGCVNVAAGNGIADSE